MTRSLFGIATPVILWALHFIAIYALISAACAPRQLLHHDAMFATASLATGAIAIGILTFLVLSARGLRRSAKDSPERPLAQAAWWTALISLLAVFANVWPILTIGNCSG